MHNFHTFDTYSFDWNNDTLAPKPVNWRWVCCVLCGCVVLTVLTVWYYLETSSCGELEALATLVADAIVEDSSGPASAAILTQALEAFLKFYKFF